MHAETLQSCPTLCNPMHCSLPGCMGFPRQEYWNGLPCSPSGDLSNPEIETTSPVAPTLKAESLPLSHQGSQEKDINKS